MSGEQMLTVGRGLRTTATAAVHTPQSTVPANSLPRVGPAAGCRCSKQHERCLNIAHINIVTLRYTKPGSSAIARYKDGSSGGAASYTERIAVEHKLFAIFSSYHLLLVPTAMVTAKRSSNLQPVSSVVT